jgi:histone H3/H4
VECIGKEANRWEEQAYLGEDETAQIVYGVDPEAAQKAVERLREELRKYPVRKVAREAGVATRTIQKVRNGTPGVRQSTVGRIQGAVERLSLEPWGEPAKETAYQGGPGKGTVGYRNSSTRTGQTSSK